MQVRKKVIFEGPMARKAGIEILQSEVDVVRPPEGTTRIAPSDMADISGILRTTVRVDRTLLEAGRLLQVVGTLGAGVDAIDVDSATALGIPVVRSPGVGADAVAEHAIGLMICLARNIFAMDKATRGNLGFAKTRGSVRNTELREKTLGVIGLGPIGRSIAQKCRLAFNMKVLAYSPSVSMEIANSVGATKVETLEELLRASDYVSVNVPRIPKNMGLIGDRQFDQMKKNAYIVDTARGGIVDEPALVRALRESKIAGAGIDVFDPEPPHPDNPLFGMNNVVLSPHTAGVTEETLNKLNTYAAQQILKVIRVEKTENLVNPNVWPVYLQRLQKLQKG